MQRPVVWVRFFLIAGLLAGSNGCTATISEPGDEHYVSDPELFSSSKEALTADELEALRERIRALREARRTRFHPPPPATPACEVPETGSCIDATAVLTSDSDEIFEGRTTGSGNDFESGDYTVPASYAGTRCDSRGGTAEYDDYAITFRVCDAGCYEIEGIEGDSHMARFTVGGTGCDGGLPLRACGAPFGAGSRSSGCFDAGDVFTVVVDGRGIWGEPPNPDFSFRMRYTGPRSR